MKKVVVLVLLIALTAGVGAFAAKGAGWAVGGEGALYFAGSSGLVMGGGALVLHTPFVPLMFGIDVSIPFSLGLTADYWFFHQNLASIFDWYVGVGGYLGLPDPIRLGMRIPIGLQAWILGSDVLELFLEITPALGIKFSGDIFYWHMQGAFGFRIWF